MQSPKYFLYLALLPRQKVIIAITSAVAVDIVWLAQQGGSEILLVQPPLPLWVAEAVWQQLEPANGNSYNRVSLKRLSKQITSLVKELVPGLIITLTRQTIAAAEATAAFNVPESSLTKLSQSLAGRILLLEEILVWQKSYPGTWPEEPETWLQSLYLAKRVMRQAAVTTDFWGIPHCRRCGSREGLVQQACSSCGRPLCWTCTECQSMGVAKSCTPLYFAPLKEQELVSDQKLGQPQFKFSLTPPQERGARALTEFLDTKAPTFLLWAVCGGGKTEVSFAAIAKVLSRGGRVLVAIPRKDVVAELAIRFQEAFPQILVLVLYGGCGNPFGESRLVVATTHQTLRFYQHFDLVILDEADAFPYRDSRMLREAVLRALKPKGKLIIMTATPDAALLKRARQGVIPSILIPARYHRQPLAKPVIYREKLCFEKKAKARWQPPRVLEKFLLEAQACQRRVLIFLPTIKMIREAGGQLVEWGKSSGLQGDFVYAGRANSPEKIQLLRKGRLDFLVTSTILERGITIPDLEVVVLAADQERIFDTPTLVQIAGRVGRLGETAQVIFVAPRISKAMKAAVVWIEQMNAEAHKLGFLD